MIILMTAVISVLTALPALAEQRDNKAFNTSNGRTVGAPVSPQVIVVSIPGGGAGSNSGPDAPASKAGFTGGGPAAAVGGHAAIARSSSRGARRGGKSFWSGAGRKVAADPTSTEEAPPNFSKPGALIRTTGQQPKYEKAEDARTQTVDAGAIVMSKHKMFDVGKAPSLQEGPKDTLPPPNPGTFSRTSTGGAAANSGPGGSSGSGGGTGGGRDNNGSGNNDKNKPGDTEDDRGGKAMTDSFNAAF